MDIEELAVEKAIVEGYNKMEKFIYLEKVFLDLKCLTDYKLRAVHTDVEPTDIPSELMLIVELQLAWGFFSEHVKTYTTSVADEQRIMLHIIHWLMNQYNLSLIKAKEDAIILLNLAAESEVLFDKIKKLGQMAYHGQTNGDLFYRVIRTLNYGM